MAGPLKKGALRKVLGLRRSNLTDFARHGEVVADASYLAHNRVDDPSLSSSVYFLKRTKLGSLDSLGIFTIGCGSIFE